MLSTFEFTRAFAYEWHNHRDQLSERVVESRLNLGWRVSYAEYRAGIAALQNYRNCFFASFEGYDLLVTPSQWRGPGGPLDYWTSAFQLRLDGAVRAGNQSAALYRTSGPSPSDCRSSVSLAMMNVFLDAADHVYRTLGQRPIRAIMSVKQCGGRSKTTIQDKLRNAIDRSSESDHTTAGPR